MVLQLHLAKGWKVGDQHRAALEGLYLLNSLLRLHSETFGLLIAINSFREFLKSVLRLH